MTLSSDPDNRIPIAWMALAMDRLAQGVALVDESSTLHYANAAAHAALRHAGWDSGDKRLQCPAAADRPTWHGALADVCRRERHRLLELRVAGEHGTVFVSMSPVALDGHTLAVTTFEREDLCGPLELQMFSSRHGLTSAENQVLQRLCRGDRPADIARQHGVARSTVLTQVAAIRSKTRRHSVQALLHQLSRLPAVRPAYVGV